MLVVLDSNVLTGDPTLEGNALTRLKTDRPRGVQVVVPAVVVAEVVDKARARVSAEAASRSKTARGLRLWGVQVDETPIDAAGAGAAFAERLGQQMAQYDWRMLPWPAVPHADVLARMHRSRSPAHHLGPSDYQDILVWHSVLEALEVDSHVVLVSNDGDFRGEDGGLAAPLAQEIDARPGSRVRLVPGVSVLLEEVLGPAAASIDDFFQRVGVDRRAIEEAVSDELSGRFLPVEIRQAIVGEVAESWISYVSDASDLEVHDVRPLLDGRIIFLAVLEVEVHLGVLARPDAPSSEGPTVHLEIKAEGRTSPGRDRVEHLQVVQVRLD